MKITILKTKNIDDTLLQQGIVLVQNAFKSINFPLEIIQQVSTKTYTTEMFANPTIGQGACVVASQILDEVDGTSDIAFLVFSNVGMFPKPLNPLQTPIKKGNCTVCQMCQEWCGTPMQPNVFAEFFAHEICHALFYLTNNVSNDTTHAYPIAFGQKPRLDYYLYLIDSLRPAFISPITPTTTFKPDVVITRNWDDGVQTYGDLNANGFSCKTLEKPWKLNQPNISCIPKGIYTCKWTFSWKFLKYTYEIQNVPARSGIRIHSGNYFFDIEGCIILGDKWGDLNHDKFADLMNSRVTLKKFEDTMKRLPFKLQIL